MEAVVEQRGLGAALHGWRTRRRVSQLELALRARTTQRHVSFIESGRSVPGRAMILRLAEALEIPLRERNALLLAAGYAPVFPEKSLEDPALAPVREALDRILDGHLPYPAVVTDRNADVVSANQAFTALTSDAAPELRQPPINLSRLLLHPRGLAPQIVNLDEWAWHVIDAVRNRASRTSNERLDALADELEELVPSPPRSNPDHIGFAVPLRLRWRDSELHLLTTLTHFGTAHDVTVAELGLEAFLPADASTASLLQELGGEPADR
jgi:transcriptional regulator with XRE-family HTH domain